MHLGDLCSLRKTSAFCLWLCVRRLRSLCLYRSVPVCVPRLSEHAFLPFWTLVAEQSPGRSGGAPLCSPRRPPPAALSPPHQPLATHRCPTRVACTLGSIYLMSTAMAVQCSLQVALHCITAASVVRSRAGRWSTSPKVRGSSARAACLGKRSGFFNKKNRSLAVLSELESRGTASF